MNPIPFVPSSTNAIMFLLSYCICIALNKNPFWFAPSLIVRLLSKDPSSLNMLIFMSPPLGTMRRSPLDVRAMFMPMGRLHPTFCLAGSHVWMTCLENDEDDDPYDDGEEQERAPFKANSWPRLPVSLPSTVPDM